MGVIHRPIKSWIPSFGQVLILVFTIILTIQPVHAEEHKFMDTSSYSIDAAEGHVIYQIIVDDVPMGTTQDHTLVVSGGDIYHLNIITSNPGPYYTHYNFDIVFTHPNGTEEKISKYLDRLPWAKYKLTLQPVYAQAQGLSNMMIAIDLDVGLTKESASVGLNTQPRGWDPSKGLSFISASGDYHETPTNTFVHVMSMSDFQEHVVNYDPIYGVKNTLKTITSSAFQWAWDAIIGFIEQIPVIGPQFIIIIEILGTLITEFTSWLLWIIANIPLIIAGGEVTIVMFAVIFAGNNPKGTQVAKNIFNYNVEVAKGFLWLFNMIFVWTTTLISMVTDIVKALKPL